MIVFDPLDVRYLEEDGKPTEDRMLLSRLRVKWRGMSLNIPKGFITDFASIPKLLRVVIRKGDGIEPAATVHDYCYRTPKVRLPRAMADKLFLDIMKDDGIWWGRRWALYSGVRAGGSSSFVKRS